MIIKATPGFTLIIISCNMKILKIQKWNKESRIELLFHKRTWKIALDMPMVVASIISQTKIEKRVG